MTGILRKIWPLVTAIILMLCTTTAYTDSTEDLLAQPAPFGYTDAIIGFDVQVYQKPSSDRVTGSIESSVLCLIVDTESLAGQSWFHIKWRDDFGQENVGYVKADDFRQMTVAGLLAICTDDIYEYIRSFSELYGTPCFMERTTNRSTSTETSTSTPKPSPKVENIVQTTAPSTRTTNESHKRMYVLNTRSKKFHYPDCKSVPEIKNSNRKDVEASRDELIKQGYSPCGNCKP